jgi:hypothetical protein
LYFADRSHYTVDQAGFELVTLLPQPSEGGITIASCLLAEIKSECWNYRSALLPCWLIILMKVK